MKKKINLRLFATLDDVMKDHGDAFVDTPDVGTQFGTISTKLKDLGYDVLINKRDAAEFVPSTRLSEVVGQRDNFKLQAEGLQKQLEILQKQQGLSPEAQKQVDDLVKTNETLLAELEKSQVTMEIMAFAADAMNPKDVVAFVNMDKVSIDKKGNVVGAKEEVERVKAEKPYMFKTADAGAGGGNNNRFGNDNGGSGAGSGAGGTTNMNNLLRRAAGIVTQQ